MIQTVTTAKNIISIFVVIIFLSSKPSGMDKPTTAMEKAITVPNGIPFSTNTCMMGKIPAVLLYMGTPIITAMGTANGLSLLMYASKNPVGINPCINPPTAIPINMYNETPLIIPPASLSIAGIR